MYEEEVAIPVLGPCRTLLDHLVGAAKERQRNDETERSCGFEVNDQLDLSDLLDRKAAGSFTLENSTRILPRYAGGLRLPSTVTSSQIVAANHNDVQSHHCRIAARYSEP